MDHFKNIYHARAADYHRMIEHEDVDGNLTACIKALLPSDVYRVLDLGSGTGRIPIILHSNEWEVVCLDLHWAMLKENLNQRNLSGGLWALAQGDSRTLPIRDRYFDVVTAGWVLGHSCAWHIDWSDQLQTVLDEMHRVARQGAVLIIMETLTTGSEVPKPPTDELAECYQWFENTWGFSRQEIRTDYSFRSVQEAISKLEFFFGKELVATIMQKKWSRVPECTGVWSKVA